VRVEERRQKKTNQTESEGRKEGKKEARVQDVSQTDAERWTNVRLDGKRAEAS